MRFLCKEWSDASAESQWYDLCGPCSKCFLPIGCQQIRHQKIPPGGKFESIYAHFSPFLALICMAATRTACGGAIHDIVKFRRDSNKKTGDIHDFLDTVSLNEIGIEQFLQSEPMKLKPSPYHEAAGSPPSDCLSVCLAG